MDALGNWSGSTTDGTTSGRANDSRNEVTSVGGSGLAYDDAGEVKTDEQGRRPTYDAWHQLVSLKDASGNALASYTTDAAGRRITQTDGSGATADLYYAGNNVIEERQAGAVTSQNAWGVTYANDLVLRDDNSTSGDLGESGSGLGRRLYAQHDANFNTTALVGPSGDVVERFAYYPYGPVTALTPQWAATTDTTGWDYLFQGMRLDPATGLYHTPNREYSPSLGRWMQMDPTAYIDGANAFQGFGGRPTSLLDPQGTQAQTPPGGPRSPLGLTPQAQQAAIQNAIGSAQPQPGTPATQPSAQPPNGASTPNAPNPVNPGRAAENITWGAKYVIDKAQEFLNKYEAGYEASATLDIPVGDVYGVPVDFEATAAVKAGCYTDEGGETKYAGATTFSLAIAFDISKPTIKNDWKFSNERGYTFDKKPDNLDKHWHGDVFVGFKEDASAFFFTAEGALGIRFPFEDPWKMDFVHELKITDRCANKFK